MPIFGGDDDDFLYDGWTGQRRFRITSDTYKCGNPVCPGHMTATARCLTEKEQQEWRERHKETSDGRRQ